MKFIFSSIKRELASTTLGASIARGSAICSSRLAFDSTPRLAARRLSRSLPHHLKASLHRVARGCRRGRWSTRRVEAQSRGKVR